jgi:hypothetical protein
LAAACRLAGEGRTGLSKLVDDIHEVVADDEERCNGGNDLGNTDQRLNLVDPGDDRLLGRAFVAEGVVEKDLVFFISRQPGAIKEHDNQNEDGKSPNGPHDGNKRH